MSFKELVDLKGEVAKSAIDDIRCLGETLRVTIYEQSFYPDYQIGNYVSFEGFSRKYTTKA